MSAAQIIEELPKLTGEELALIADRLADVELAEKEVGKSPRTPGLGKGKVWISDDFDDPLPDEFWLGEDM